VKDVIAPEGETEVRRKEKREHRITNKGCRISKGKNLLDSPVPGPDLALKI
jgi:hypothetical protein